MKTIREHLDSGMSTINDLRAALLLAMRVEFATIPPYLCAQWSIKSDPDRVEAVLHRIVSQEMSHFALIGNLLRGLGEEPKIANPEFLPVYPMYSLPGGIRQSLPINLLPLGREQLRVFMQIERPEYVDDVGSQESSSRTIGEFYDAIVTSLAALRPLIEPSAFAVNVPNFKRLCSLEDAINAITRIKEEGEGMSDSPDEPSSDADRATLAHYYAFMELYVQRRLVRKGGRWSFAGERIMLPEVYQFQLGQDPSASTEFSRTLSRLLMGLQSCWARGEPPNVAAMLQLSILGRDMVRRGIRPDFVWEDPKDISPSTLTTSDRAHAFEDIGKIAWGAKVSPTFKRKLIQIADHLGIVADYLMAAMAFETAETFSPSIKNPTSGATGLIQFIASTAGELGTSIAALANMTAEDQLDYVQKYLDRYGGQLNTIEDVYMAILWPGAIGKSGSYVLFSAPSTAYIQNSRLDADHDGRITKDEAAAKVKALLVKGMGTGFFG